MGCFFWRHTEQICALALFHVDDLLMTSNRTCFPTATGVLQWLAASTQPNWVGITDIIATIIIPGETCVNCMSRLSTFVPPHERGFIVIPVRSETS
eukprot:6471847-Amphidinium_carterae.1